MASLDAECEPSIVGQAAAEAEIGVLEPSAGNKASTGTGDAAEPASRRLSQGATATVNPTSDSMGNISSQSSKEVPRCGAGPEAEARPPEAEGPGGRGDETGSRETPCKSVEACPSLETHHADTGPVARTAPQPLPKGHAAKTFPASPTKAPGANRAKMTLTGVSKSTNTIQSLAMKLLSVPNCRGGKEPPPATPATPAAPAQDNKPKVHKARKSISRPAQRPLAEMRGHLPEWGGQTAAAGGPSEVEYVATHPEENLEGHRARKSIMKGSFSQSLAEKLSSLPIERLSQLAGGGGEVEHVAQPHDEGPEIHRARKSIMKGGFSQALAMKLSNQAHTAASHENPEYPEVHRARKSHLGGSFSQSLARSLASETVNQGVCGVSTATSERPTVPRGLAEKPKLHRARKSMFKSSPAQIKLVEMKGDLDRSGSMQQSTQLQFDMLPGRGPGEGSTGLVKRRRPESLGPESARANSLLKEEMAKEVPPLGPMRGGHGARASVSSGAAEALSRARGHEMKAVGSGAAAIPVLDLSKEAESQDKEEIVDPWAAEVGDDYSFFYDSYSVDGRADSDKSSKTEGDVGEDRLSDVEDDEEELEGSGNHSDRSSSSSLKRKGKKKWKNESPWVKPSRKRRRKDRVKPGKGGAAVSSARGGGAPAQSEYTEVPLSSLELPNDNSLSPEPTGASNDASSMETDKYEELPLCSCRMEAPKIDRITELSNNTCMATESTDGQVSGSELQVELWAAGVGGTGEDNEESSDRVKGKNTDC
ncbi:histone-lysine N-methyltransferase EHMT2-like [Amblyraja radiata]|uniref:histone-lysine N-methyltransferase EHMT2-like n=1 Tax=Amblyraja radiata TaxID=386614 RepID=UPI001402B334|nr:histone-lysine N-methyltransferase EHMT2-like [Amblyraja radiata]